MRKKTKPSVTENRRRLNALGTAIKAARTTRGIRLLDLAKALEISLPFLSDVENGRRNLSDDRIQDLADFLGVPAMPLLEMAAQDRGKVTLDLNGADPKRFELALLLGRAWPNVPNEVIDPLIAELRNIVPT